MTTIANSPTTTRDATSDGLPGRRLLVGLAGVYLVLFGALMATSSDREADVDPAKLIAGYDISDGMIYVMVYGTVVIAAVLVFYGAALRSVLSARTRHWTGDAAFIGFVTMALTLGSWAVTALALHHAVGIGDTRVVQSINVLDTTNFPPAMLALMCAMVGVGLTALKGQSLPKWLAVASIVIGCLAPLGPLGFVPFLLFPIWVVVVAAMVRRDPA
jgi:hypothetical protein